MMPMHGLILLPLNFNVHAAAIQRSFGNQSGKNESQ
jgi:hypothetical protein